MDTGTAGAGAGGAGRARANENPAGQCLGERLGLLLDGAAAGEKGVFQTQAQVRRCAKKDGIERGVKECG